MMRPVAKLTPDQLRWHNRIEAVIRLMQPGLDLVLLAGDRLSRAVDRSDDEPAPALRFPDGLRPVAPGPALPRGGAAAPPRPAAPPHGLIARGGAGSSTPEQQLAWEAERRTYAA